jgi:hypothetical protein
LYAAVANDVNRQIVELLLKNGANINQTDQVVSKYPKTKHRFEVNEGESNSISQMVDSTGWKYSANCCNSLASLTKDCKIIARSWGRCGTSKQVWGTCT